MTSLVAHPPHTCIGDSRPLRTSSLPCLIALICRTDDRRALNEFHGYRPVFRLRGGPPLRLVELVDALRQESAVRRIAGHDPSVQDQAYDLTIDKFFNLPKTCSQAPPVKQSGSDCRFYLGAALASTEVWKRSHPSADTLQEETVIARSLQRHVVRHFYLSCLEARRRSDRARSRYAWTTRRGVIYVWLPLWLPGNQRRAWLEANVGAPVPGRTDERRRVQAIVDSRLGVVSSLSVGYDAGNLPTRRIEDHPLTWLLEQEITTHGLAETVADEKVHNIEQQRKAIRDLGESTLYRLILRIFEDLRNECYRDGTLANTFGVSKATFSRFAGSRWRTNSRSVVPDLWANTAKVLAHHSSFVEMAQGTKVWPLIDQIVRADAMEGLR